MDFSIHPFSFCPSGRTLLVEHNKFRFLSLIRQSKKKGMHFVVLLLWSCYNLAKNFQPWIVAHDAAVIQFWSTLYIPEITSRYIRGKNPTAPLLALTQCNWFRLAAWLLFPPRLIRLSPCQVCFDLRNQNLLANRFRLYWHEMVSKRKNLFFLQTFVLVGRKILPEA